MKKSQFKSMAAIVLVLAILFSQLTLVQDQALTLSSATWKPAVPMNGQFDYLVDQQTASGLEVSQDIVGDNTYPAFYTSYDATLNEIGFRIRLNDRDGNNDTLAAFKNFAFVGVDVANSNGTFDSKLDFFVGIYNVSVTDKNRGRIGIYNTDPAKSNDGPSTTGIINPAIIQYSALNAAQVAAPNFTFAKADSSLGTVAGASGNSDWFISFKVPVDDINLAMQMVGKPYRITSSTALRYIIGTAAQDNSFNQDIGGLQGFNSKSTTTWNDLGVFTPISSPSGTGLNVNFYNDLTGSNVLLTTMTAVSGYSLGSLPYLAPSNGNYFLGWSTDPAATTADFTDTTKVTEATNLYSVWTTATNTVRFYDNYDASASDDTDKDYQSLSIGTNTAIGTSIPLPDPTTRSGYVFAGWYGDRACTGSMLLPSSVITADTSFYAKWEPVVTVSFDAGGGSFDTSGDPVTVIQGTSLGSFPIVSRKNYYLTGWQGSDGKLYTESTVIDSTVKLTAQWSASKYTVTFDDGISTTTDAILDVATGSPVGTLPVPPLRSGYLFDGWYTASSGGDLVTSSTVFPGDTTVYAHWIELVQVVFNNNYDRDSIHETGETYATENVYSGSSLGVLPSHPQLADYTFTGWQQADGSPFNQTTLVSTDTIVYAQWALTSGLKSATVQFYFNDGSSPEIPYTERTVNLNLDSSEQLYGYLNDFPMDPIREGYVFAGWSTSPNGAAGTEFDSNTKITAEGDLPVYAIWHGSYTLTYTAGDNGSISGTTSQTVDHGGNGTEVTAVPDTGYHFVEWSDGVKTAKRTDLNVTADKSVTAEFALDTYTVTYDAGSGSGAPTESSAYKQGDTVTVLGAGGMTRTGYTFAGWDTDSSADEVVYDPEKTFTMGNSNVTLYAVWTANSYSVIYNGNSNTGGSAPTDSDSYNIADTVTVKGNTGSLVKTGYTFAGWNTAANGSGIAFSGSDTFAMGNSNVTLYAQWVATDYSVTYNGNTNTGGAAPTDSGSYNITDTVTVKGNTGSLVKTGYTFAGWNTAANGSGTAYSAGVTFAMGSSNVTLYAQWTLNRYTVTYDAGSGSGAPTDSNTYEQGATVTVSGKGDMTCTGYTFAGWDTDSSADAVVYDPEKTFAMGSANVTLYAVWTLDDQAIMFNANGGTGSMDAIAAQPGRRVTLPENTFTREDYAFAGWRTSANGPVVYTDGAELETPAGGLELFAAWRPLGLTDSGDQDDSITGLAQIDNLPAKEVKLVIESIGKESGLDPVIKIYTGSYDQGSAIRVYDIYMLQRDTSEDDWTDLPTDGITDFHAKLYINIQDYVSAGGDPKLLSVHYFDDDGEWSEEMDILGFEEIDGITYLVFETDHFSYYVLLADEKEAASAPKTPGKVELTTLLHIPETGARTTDMKSFLSIPEQWMRTTKSVEVWIDLQPVAGPYSPPQPTSLKPLKAFDVRLLQRVTDDQGQQTTREVDPQHIVHNVTVMLPLSPSLAAQADLQVAHVGADGQMAYLDYERQEIDGVTYLVVANNSFYQLWVFGAEATGNQTVAAIPKTGDQDASGILLGLLLVGGFALLLAWRKINLEHIKG
jgi:uncharacterized repeat protein (TIGR02543 family)/LPXTG-motif cell wall-anchored protein